MERFNPFNPQQPAKPHFFVGRSEEIKNFENFLSQTIHSSPMNLSITGDRGMGKTSMLNKFEEIALKKNCLVVNISSQEGNMKEMIDFSEFLISNIQRELISKTKISNKKDAFLKWLSSFKPKIEFEGFTLTMEKQVIQKILREKLQEIWEKVKDKYKAIVILIDEAEYLEKIGILTFLREVLQRVQSKSNYMIVLAGKFNFPEKMSESFSPLNRFFPAQRLRRLSQKEVKNYLKNRLNETNVNISNKAMDNIFKKSEGHPYVLVCMGFWVFSSLEDKSDKVDNNLVNRCGLKIKGKLSQDFFTPMFYPLSPSAKKILFKIALNIKGLKFNLKEASEITGMKNNQLSPYFGDLLKKGILTKPNRGIYWIFHSLFKDYLIHNYNRFVDS